MYTIYNNSRLNGEIKLKIRIIGPVGSGKTTFAQELGNQYLIPVTSLDGLNWIRTSQGDIHRTRIEPDKLIKEILNKDNWVIEGAQYRYGKHTFQGADLIYFMNISHTRNIFYLMKRYLKAKFRRESSPYSNLHFFNMGKKLSGKERQEIITLLNPFNDKAITLKK